jgi:hypothetical protein
MVMEANTPPDFALKTDTDDLDLPAEQVVVANLVTSYQQRSGFWWDR